MNYEPGNTRTTENLNPFFNHSLSADVVEYLRTVRDMTLKQIGDMLDLSESFISRVANKQRNFTQEHLERLERELGAPLPLLTIEALWLPRASAAQKEMLEGLLQGLRTWAEIQQDIWADEKNAGDERDVAKSA